MKASDALGCVGWAGLLLSMPVWMPFFGPIFSLLSPLPFLYYSFKLGFHQGVKLTLLAVTVVGLAAQFAGVPYIAAFGLEFGVLGLTIAFFLEKRWGPGSIVLVGTAVMVALSLGMLTFIAARHNSGPGQLILAYIGAQLKASMEAYQSMGMAPEGVAELEAFSKSLMDGITKVYPALMVLGTGVVVWMNLVASRAVIRRFNLAPAGLMPLDRWRAPELLVWVLIASGFTAFLVAGWPATLAVNVLIVTMAVYLFHGFSIILFFLNRYHVPRWARVGVYVVIFMQQFLLAILALVGLFDQWVDFRKMRRKEFDHS